MKHTYVKLLLRGVKKTYTRFFSILAIVAVGVCFLSGLISTCPDMELSVDTRYNETNFFDINIRGTLGLTDGDVTAVSELDYVENAMPARVTDVVMSTGEVNYVTRIYGIDLDRAFTDDFVNRFELLEGRMPENENECLLSSPNGYARSHSIGEVYIISEDNKNFDSLADTYNFTELTVVGFVSMPYYMSFENEPSSVGSGSVELVMLTFPESYSLEVYTDIFLTIGDARQYNSFSDEYEHYMEDISERLEGFGEQRAALRTAEVKSEAQRELDDAKAEYEKAKSDADTELSDARQELDDGWAELSDAGAEIEEKSAELSDAQSQVNSAHGTLTSEIAARKEGLYERIEEAAAPQYDAALEEINLQKASGRAQISAAQAQLDIQREAIEEQERQLQAAEAAGIPVSEEDKAAVEAAKIQLEAAQQEIDFQLSGLEDQIAAAIAELEKSFAEIIESEYSSALAAIDAAEAEARAEISQAQAEIDDGLAKLSQARVDLENAELELTDGEREYEQGASEAESELTDAQTKIDDAQREIDDIEDAQWYITGRADTVSFPSYKMNMEKVDAIAKVFPVFFFLVAALVALTTMTRMVEEERTQIGTLKALGYSNGVIMFYYIGYSVLASLAGTAIGCAVGFSAIPTVISKAYGMMYTLPPLMTPFRWDMALLITPIAVGCTTISTLAAGLSQLREKPSTLMLPRAPSAGKRVLLERVGFIWKRLSFTWKVTVRNIFRYKKRLYMTVCGVAGCGALLVTGFGLRDSIADIVRLQFDEVYKYNVSIYLKDEDALTKDEHVKSFLEDESRRESFALVHAESITVEAENGTEKTSLYVPESREALREQITLRDRESGQMLEFNANGVILTEKLCELMEIELGDKITLRNTDGKSVSATVTGMTEAYVMNCVYMDGAFYEQLFDAAPEYELILATISDESEQARDALSHDLLQSGEVLMVQFSENIRSSFSKTVNSINYIVIVLIVAAGLLAVVVLYNLTNINISERKKELATIKVLGFHEAELAAYIYRETTFLCLIGIVGGFFLGALLHQFVIRTAEVSNMMFGRSVYPMSYVYSALITLLFTLIVDLIMLKKLRGIDMVESMKANE